MNPLVNIVQIQYQEVTAPLLPAPAEPPLAWQPSYPASARGVPSLHQLTWYSGVPVVLPDLSWMPLAARYVPAPAVPLYVLVAVLPDLSWRAVYPDLVPGAPLAIDTIAFFEVVLPEAPPFDLDQEAGRGLALHILKRFILPYGTR